MFITAQSSLGGEAQSGVEALQGPCCHRQNAAVSQRSPGAYVRARNAALEAKENELTTALSKQTELNEAHATGNILSSVNQVDVAADSSSKREH